jgi:Ca2+/H+ antiporter, TMEM165/GDT1 family
MLQGLLKFTTRTQLLSLILLCRYRRAVSIIFGILIATLACNILAALTGLWAGSLFVPSVLKWILGISFIGMAIWVLIPDKALVDDTVVAHKRSVFIATLIGFIVAEMGDKTQIATVALAAHFHQFSPVVLGSTVGMMVANLPVVPWGQYIGDRISSSPVTRYAAAAIFVAEALATLLNR